MSIIPSTLYVLSPEIFPDTFSILYHLNTRKIPVILEINRTKPCSILFKTMSVNGELLAMVAASLY